MHFKLAKMKKPGFVIALVTIYLFTYAILGQLNIDLKIMALLFAFSPFLVIWMVYTVLKHGKYSGKELSENEEWGYQDIDKNKLNKF